MATPPPVTDKFAEFVSRTELSTVPKQTRENAKLHILDTLGVALAAVDQPAAEIALAYCRRLGASGEASIWGTRSRTAVSTAAFANGLLAHALDFDDWDAFINLGHPSSMLLGAALSLGEHLGASGGALLKAYVLGVEVISKIAANAPRVQDRGFHSTPIFGSLGAALACASLLQLDRDSIKAALGIAASAAGGIHRQQGSMVKPFHAGNAARNGAEAALLAQSGFTADPAIIEAPRGFCDTFFGPGTCEYDGMIAAIGAPYFLESPGLGLKLHPCSAPQFLAADAALYLKRAHGIRYHDVAKIEVRIPPMRYQRHYAAEVKTGLRGKFAVNYVVAMGFLEGKLDLATFTDAKVAQPLVQEALGKVEVVCDETIPEPGRYCPVSVQLKDGNRFSHTATIAKGHPRNPLTEAEVREKFLANARAAISEQCAAELIAAVASLESLDHVGRIADLLAPG
jgi:2-methylcitrate dehydratase PrpD